MKNKLESISQIINLKSTETEYAFKVMLAPNKLPIITNINYPCYIQPKIDGFRNLYKNGVFYSRKGKSFGNKNLTSYFSSLVNITDYVLDGELYCDGEDFNTVQSILSTHDAPLPSNLKFIVFDCIPVKDWEKQICNKPYDKRLKDLREVLASVADYKKIIDIPNDEIQTANQAVEYYKNYLTKGYEGAIIRSINGLYRWKRVTVNSGEILKLKPFKTLDLQITSFLPGEKGSKYENTLGSIIVSNSDGISSSVGSGFTDDNREEIWKNQGEYIGKTVEIQYIEITKEKSLRHPTFKRFRNDK